MTHPTSLAGNEPKPLRHVWRTSRSRRLGLQRGAQPVSNRYAPRVGAERVIGAGEPRRVSGRSPTSSASARAVQTSAGCLWTMWRVGPRRAYDKLATAWLLRLSD